MLYEVFLNFAPSRKKLVFLAIILMLCAFALIGIGYLFSKTLKNLYSEQANVTLASTCKNITDILHYNNTNSQSYLNAVATTLSKSLGKNPQSDVSEILKFIPYIDPQNAYLGFISPEGKIKFSSSEKSTIEFDRVTLKKLLQSDNAFYGLGYINNTGELFLMQTSLVEYEGQNFGRLFRAEKRSAFRKLLLPQKEYKNVWNAVLDSNAVIVDGTAPAVSLGEDVLKVWDTSQDAAMNELNMNFQNKTSYFGEVVIKDVPYYVYLTPTVDKKWFVLACATTDSIHGEFQTVLLALVGTGGLLFCLYGGIILYTVQVQRKERKQAQTYAQKLQTLFEQIPSCVIRFKNNEEWTVLEYGRSFLPTLGIDQRMLAEDYANSWYNLVHPHDRESLTISLQTALQNDVELPILEYRLLLSDSKVLWVLESMRYMHDDEGGWFWSVITNITERKLKELRSHNITERYKSLFEASEKMLYEYDWNTQEFKITAQFFEKFNYPLPQENNDYYALDIDVIHPEDMDLFNAMHLQLQVGNKAAEALIRIKDQQERWIWCQFRQNIWSDSVNNTIKAIGEMRNVDEETRSLQKLRDDVQRDAFTGLYNKIATAELILSELKLDSTERGVLCIIDVDNFKQVNDTLGHARGDAVIKDLASGLTRIFRSDDIVGRIGGDEFLVYIKNMQKLGTLLVKIDRVISFFKQSLKGDNDVVNISCSIGIALFPKDGNNYQDLYNHADKALYRSKKKKGIYTFYDPNIDL